MTRKRSVVQTQAVLKYPAHLLTPEDLLTFVELRAFSTRWDGFGLNDHDLGMVQTLIMINPTRHPVIAGTGGLRKMRCGKINVSKRDGYRVCYVYIEEFKTVLMVTIYAKNELDTIPESHKPAFRKVIERVHRELAKGLKRFGPPSDSQETR